MTVIYRRARLTAVVALLFSSFAHAQQTATSGAFVLHKFANAIGSETYSIEAKDGSYTLTSHFKFTDRGTEVPLETTFVAEAGTMTPVSYSAKGKASRQADMNDVVAVSGDNVSIVRSGKSETHTANEPWFITDGYSPAAMQEQMMRWWLSHGKPDRSKSPVLELDGPRVKDLISTLQSHYTVVDPTVSLYEMFLHTKPLAQVEPGIAHLPPQLREALDSPPATGDKTAVAVARWQAMMASVRPSPCGRNSYRCGYRSGNSGLFIASRT